MELFRGLRAKAKNTLDVAEQVADRWLMKNPYAVLSRLRFVNNQKKLYNPRFAKVWLLGKVCLLGYLVANLTSWDFNEPYRQDRKLLTEYYVLASMIEYDRLQQLGVEPHLRKLYERGRRRGLSQIQLLELIKLHEANQPTKNMASHIEYLRELKS